MCVIQNEGKGGKSNTCTKHFYIVAEASWQQRFESPFHSCYWEVAALPEAAFPPPLLLGMVM